MSTWADVVGISTVEVSVLRSAKAVRAMAMIMIPAPDFADALDRHWQDGETLHLSSRLANADHLYGLAAECGLKALMKALGMPTEPSGEPTRQYRKHIDELWAIFASFVAGGTGAHYATMLPTTNPFLDWSVHQRYANQAHFTATTAASHQAGADAVRKCVDQARVDGVAI